MVKINSIFCYSIFHFPFKIPKRHCNPLNLLLINSMHVEVRTFLKPQIADFKSYIVYVAILKSVGLGSRLQTNENKSLGLGLWVEMWVQRVNKQLEHVGIS